MAAYRRPELFRGLVLFEPIVFPTDVPGPHGEGPSPLVVGARRRRSSFDSLDDALANYSSKPPMNAFTPAALRAYVEHGFLQGDDGQVHLRCAPEHEARTFESGGRHRTWDVLGEIDVPTWVVAGRVDPGSPAALAAAIADRLPHGRTVILPDLDHFGPMTHPERLADLVAAAAAELEA
jgi:pimeloyl-ACP methyl ester carboxylesterase